MPKERVLHALDQVMCEYMPPDKGLGRNVVNCVHSFLFEFELLKSTVSIMRPSTYDL